MSEVTVTLINSVWCKIEYPLAPEIWTEIDKVLSYPDVFWSTGIYGEKNSKEVFKPTYAKRKDGIYFFTGLLPKVREKFRTLGEKLTIVGHYPKVPSQEPFLPPTKFSDGRVFTDFREDQKAMILRAVTRQRGILVGFTGYGKSITAMGIMSSFPDQRILCLFHSIDLLKQFSDDMVGFKIDHGRLYGKEKQYDKRITLATRQTIAGLDEKHPLKNPASFAVVIVDEVHHVSDLKGEYCKDILIKMDAPVRIGFTATIPSDRKRSIAMEAMFGPTIAEFSLDEGKEAGLLAEPKIAIRKLPVDHALKWIVDADTGKKRARNWEEVHYQGIMNNRQQAELMLEDIRYLLDNKMTTLVFVTRVAHGEALSNFFSSRLNKPIPFINGTMDLTGRHDLKRMLKSGEIKCAIANVVWREGINIPSLNVIINASGGASDLQLLQTAGRGLRTFGNKSEVLIIDYFNPSHIMLVKQFGERISVYMDKGWGFTSIQEFVERNKEV